MKICYIANPNTVHARRWVAGLRDMGHQVHFVGFEPYSGTIPQGITFHDLSAIINIRKVRFAIMGAVLYRLIRKIQPDVLHGDSIVGSGWLGAAAMWHPFVATSHGSDLLMLPNKSFVQRQLAKFVLSSADRILCVSKQLYDLAGELGVPENKREMMSLGVDTSVFFPGPVDPVRQNSLNLGNGPVFLSIRAVRPIYNPMLVCQAFVKVHRIIPEAKLIILTGQPDTSLLSDIKRFFVHNNVEGAVRFLPYVDSDNEMADLYRLADISISVASSDGTPKSVQESMACGTPVIAADIFTIRQCVNHERDGLLVPVSDPDALSKAMINLIKNDDLKKEMGKAATRAIHDSASLNSWMAEHNAMYEKLLNKTPPK